MNAQCPSRSGATLVEVVMAILLLSILAVAGAASMNLSRGMASVQKNHRTALEIASGRLEDVRAAGYASIRPSASNYNAYFLSRTGANWVVSSSNPGETVLVNGRSRPMVTTVQYVDIDAGSASYDAVRVWVSLQYHGNTSSVVVLETVRSQ